MLLNDTNYTSWKAYIQQRLQDEGLLAITLGDQLMPQQDGTDGKEIEEFKKKSRLAFYLLIKAIDDSAMRNLRSIKFKNNPDEFVEQIRASFANMEHAGLQFDETTWMVLFLSQLPRNLSDSIVNRNDQDVSSTHSQQSSISSCDHLFEKLKALSITPANTYQIPKPNENQKHGPPPPSYQVLSCTQCNKKGHDPNSSDNDGWRATATPKQSTSDQSGWNEPAQSPAPPSATQAGWNDSTPSPAAFVNESGWTDNVHDFKTLSTPSGWDNPQE
ncbi:hypothetical protein PtA15_1A903 [Puccinia triticina]|uniref:DUF4219 domain-containing protein n=1 Tax=Puccinia triticina TaxID=208348 RepID=A0ABY7C8R0_9BASI|nr:uncharacterized protein PtA15_1A903 [Puccinia triticina]WAQ81561.1 hypothetical protein PtA15_1A903 [Puccinia triticina]